MLNLHRRVGRVYPLASRAGGPADVDLQVVRLDFDIDSLRLGQHGDGNGARVHAALCLGGWHALYAVDAAFELELPEHVLPLNPEDDFLESA